MESAESCTVEASSNSEATVGGDPTRSAARRVPGSAAQIGLSKEFTGGAQVPPGVTFPANAVLPSLLVEPPSFHGQMVRPFSTRRRRKERLFSRQVIRPKPLVNEAAGLAGGVRSDNVADTTTAAAPAERSESVFSDRSPHVLIQRENPFPPGSPQRAEDIRDGKRLWRRWLRGLCKFGSGDAGVTTPFPSTQRVNQLDALRVNSELVLSLQQMFLQCFENVAPWLQRRHQEVDLGLQAFLWAAFTLRDRPTPGDLLQNVKYGGGQQLQRMTHQRLMRRQHEDAIRLARGEEALAAKVRLQERMLLHAFLRRQRQQQQEQPLPLRCKLGLLLLHVLLPYLYQKLREVLHRKRVEQQAAVEQRIRRYNIIQAMKLRKLRAQNQQQPCIQNTSAEYVQQDYPGESEISLTRAERTLEKLYRTCMLIDFLLGLARFVHFFSFLSRGRYRTVGDALLRLQLTPIHPALRRNVSFELLQHEVFWQSASHVLLLLLPFIDILSIKRFSRKYVVEPSHSAATVLLQRLRSFGVEREGEMKKHLEESRQRYGAASLVKQAKQRVKAFLEDVGLKVPEFKLQASGEQVGFCVAKSQTRACNYLAAGHSDSQLSKVSRLRRPVD